MAFADLRATKSRLGRPFAIPSFGGRATQPPSARERLFAAEQASTYLSDPRLTIGTSVAITQQRWWRGEQTQTGALVMLGWDECVLAQRHKSAWQLTTIPYRTIRTITPVAERSLTNEMLSTGTPRLNIDLTSAHHAHARLAKFAQFRAWDGWAETASNVRQEIAALRGLASRGARRAYVQAVARQSIAHICTQRNISRIGWHYNLHGGHPENYIAAGGIRATRGDIAAIHARCISANQVYFFNSEQTSFFETLHTGNPQSLWGFGRMGHVLIPFDLDAPVLQCARANGAILQEGSCVMTIDTAKAERSLHGAALGVPAAAFLTPPMTVFYRTEQRLGMRRLNRLEETLATLRYVERTLLHDTAVPTTTTLTG